jgi:hypothetical protein
LKISKEELYHFNCKYCGKWWSIRDADMNEKKGWYCPWCGCYELTEYMYIKETDNSNVPVEVHQCDCSDCIPR